MRNIFSALVVVLALVLNSCSDDNDKDNDVLVGTCWDKQDISPSYNYRRICFGAGRGSFSYKMSNDGPYRSYELKYTYQRPNIKITYEDGSRFGSGYIESDMLYITDGFDAGEYEKND